MLFIICMMTGGFWISTMTAASSCCDTEGLPERGNLDAKHVVLAYGAVGFSLVLMMTIIRWLSAGEDLMNSFIGVVAYLIGLVYLGLYLWIFIVGLLLESKHFDDQPFGLNVLVLMVVTHFFLFAMVGLYTVCRLIDPF